MSEFKVGDRVKVVDALDIDENYLGKVGEVVWIDHAYHWPFQVLLDGDDETTLWYAGEIAKEDS